MLALIRTGHVRLTTLDGVAYCQKLKGGGAGIVINKRGCDQPRRADVNRRVASMVADRESVEILLLFVVNHPLQTITKNRNLDDKMVTGIIELLDEVSPRYVFKDLQDEIRRRLARK